MDVHIRMRKGFAGRQMKISRHAVDLEETVHLASVSSSQFRLHGILRLS
jgi:hypothetical protein